MQIKIPILVKEHFDLFFLIVEFFYLQIETQKFRLSSRFSKNNLKSKNLKIKETDEYFII